MSAVADTYTPRLKEQYENEIRPRLKEELGLDSIMQAPRIEKITLNMGVGEAKTESKLLDSAIEELTTIAGPRSMDGRGNFSLGIREQLIFPEINYDDIQQVRGLDVTITTSAENDEQALALLRALGLPFADSDRREQ